MPDDNEAALRRSFFEAAEREDRATLVTLIEREQISIDLRDDRGNTALIRAMAPYGAIISSVKLLIELGADVNARNDDGESALVFGYGGVTSALEHGSVAEAERLLRAAGFAERPDDAPEGSLAVGLIRAHLARLAPAQIDHVELTLCQGALSYLRSVAGDPMSLLFQADGREPRLVACAARALAATSAGAGDRSLGEELDRLVGEIERQGGVVSASWPICWLAIYNLFRRRVQGHAVGAKVVIAQALRAEHRDRRFALLKWAMEQASRP